MNFEKKMKQLYKHIKSGRITAEIADEISDFINEVEDLGDDVSHKYHNVILDMKKALKKQK